MPKRLDGTLAVLIRKVRAKRGLTQQALAVRAGISRRQLRVIMQGGNTTVLRLIGLAQALGLREVDLGGGVIGRVERAPSTPVDLKKMLRHLTEIEKHVRSARKVLTQPRVRHHPES